MKLTKACPFCSNLRTYAMLVTKDWYAVHCSACKARGSAATTRQSAIAVWNLDADRLAVAPPRGSAS